MAGMERPRDCDLRGSSRRSLAPARWSIPSAAVPEMGLVTGGPCCGSSRIPVTTSAGRPAERTSVPGRSDRRVRRRPRRRSAARLRDHVREPAATGSGPRLVRASRADPGPSSTIDSSTRSPVRATARIATAQPGACRTALSRASATTRNAPRGDVAAAADRRRRRSVGVVRRRWSPSSPSAVSARSASHSRAGTSPPMSSWIACSATQRPPPRRASRAGRGQLVEVEPPPSASRIARRSPGTTSACRSRAMRDRSADGGLALARPARAPSRRRRRARRAAAISATCSRRGSARDASRGRPAGGPRVHAGWTSPSSASATSPVVTTRNDRAHQAQRPDPRTPLASATTTGPERQDAPRSRWRRRPPRSAPTARGIADGPRRRPRPTPPSRSRPRPTTIEPAPRRRVDEPARDRARRPGRW